MWSRPSKLINSTRVPAINNWASQLDPITFHIQELSHLCHKMFITSEFLFLLSWYLQPFLTLALRKTWRTSRPIKRLWYLSGQLNEDVYSIHSGNPKRKKKKGKRSRGFWKNMSYIIILFHKLPMTYFYHLGSSSPKRGKKFHKTTIKRKQSRVRIFIYKGIRSPKTLLLKKEKNTSK